MSIYDVCTVSVRVRRILLRADSMYLLIPVDPC